MPLTKAELSEFLNEPRLAHLATTSRNGRPHASPIWFLLENGSFYFTTRLGRVKGNLIQHNPQVSLSIATDERPYRAVCVFGKATVVKEGRDRFLERIATRYGEPEAREWLAKVLKQPDRVVFALKPDRVLSWHYGRGDSENQDKGVSMATRLS